MTGIIDLAKAREARAPHCSGTAFCMACNHEWNGVWPAGSVDLECPECRARVGRSRYEVRPGDGTLVWQCKSCGNQFFNLLQDRVHCPGCGNQWGYDEL